MNMFLELIRYFLTTEKVDNKEVLRKKYCGFNDTYKKYFGITWNTLEQLENLVEDKLNPKYTNVYNWKDEEKDKNIDFIIDSTIDIIKKYSVENNKCLEYFKFNNCEYVLVDVFAYNENAINFYNKKGYHPRMYTDIKKL